jgi:hypothetical protein
VERTFDLPVSYPEVTFLSECMGPFDSMVGLPEREFPEGAELETMNLGYGAVAIGGGPKFRARVLSLRNRLAGSTGLSVLPVTVAELWAIDAVLYKFDIVKAKLRDQTPLVDFAHKVWDALGAAYEAGPDEATQEETRLASAEFHEPWAEHVGLASGGHDGESSNSAESTDDGAVAAAPPDSYEPDPERLADARARADAFLASIEQSIKDADSESSK